MSYKTLKKGVKGPPVKLLQQKLNEWLKTKKVHPDGDFGPATDHAVRLFQKLNALPADGVGGPVTWARLDQQGQLIMDAHCPRRGGA